MKLRFLFAVFLSLPLCSCVDRDQADARLARGCEAAAALFLPEGTTIREVRKRVFSAAEEGAGFRRVVLTAIETDGWSDVDKAYECVFVEEFGFLGNGYTAQIERLTADGNIYGKKEGKILGEFGDHLKLTETVEKALNSFPE